ncbi:MAG TPA: hypothetical protein V6C81_20840 [Planktothrix sp.]|jgi:DNA-binding NtrC family response regulator
MTEIIRSAKNLPSETYRILVLNEQESQLQQIIKACKRIGQEVVPCQSLSEAFKFLKTKDHVDAFVCEAFMQNESVFEFLKAAKNDAIHKDAPVMLVAAEPTEVAMFCMDGVAQAAEILGAYKFLVLPTFAVDQLTREIEAMLPREKLPMKEIDPAAAY